MALGVSAGAFFNSKKATEEVLAAPSRSYTNGDKATYYNGIDSSKSGNDLLADLRSLNLSRRKSTVGYDSMGTTADGQFKYTDYDPDTVKYDSNGQPYGTKILSFYSGKSTTSFNREHVWPNSRGGGSKGSAGSPYPDADIFMPRPTITAENSDRGNSVYVEGMCHSSNGWDPVTAFETSMGVYPGIRGECARIVFYCMTVNSKLTLNDNISNDRTNMGKLTDLLKWNIEYGVNAREENRNEGGEYLQGNRNAFVDHPEYACKIWGNTNSATKAICATEVKKELSSLSYSGTPHTTLYYEGETFDPNGLTVTATFDNGSTENVTSSVVWTPSPLTKGTTSVTGKYTYNGVTKQVTVSGITVNDTSTPIPVTGISLSDTSISMYKDETKTLTATIIPSNASNKTVYWSSNNESVASVTNGVVRANSVGSAVITAKTADGNKTAICSVTVSDAPAISSITFGRGDFTASSAYAWSPWSKDGLSGNGFIYGGVANMIQMNTSKSAYGIYSNTSIGKAIKSITVKTQTGQSDRSLDVRGSTSPFTNDNWKTAGTSFGEKKATTSGTTWDFTGNNQYFSINLTSGGAGYLSEITINYDSSSTPEVKSLSLDKSNISLSMSGTKTATLTPTVTADTGADTTVYWSSNDESIVSVSKASGTKDESVTLTANKSGSAVITAICGSKTVTCNVTVESGNVAVTGVSLSDSSKTLVVGGSFTLTATVSPSNATNKNVTWSSSNTSVASVNNGTVTALSSGTTTITVSTEDGNKTATCNVTVNAQTINVTGVSLDKTEADILVGGTDLTLVPTVQPSNATNNIVSWSSNNTSVATVEDGVVHAVSDGTAVITVTTVDGSKTASCTVHVTTPPVVVDVTGVSLNHQEATMEIGDTKNLVATVIPSNATNKNVTWSSSDESVATVNNGVVTAHSAGTAEIVVTTNNGYSASCNVTVTQYIPPTPVDDKVMTELVITSYPDKTVYTVGEEFDKTGLKVEVNYLDETSKEVDDIFITGIKKSVAGLQTASVVYNELGKNVRTSFDVLYLEAEATIVSISKASNFAKTEYYVGDELLLLGLKVNGTLSDGSVVDVTDLVDISCDLSSVGSKEVTILLGDVDPIVSNVTVKEGKPTSKEEAMDFVYEYEYKVSEVTEDVTKAQWLVLEHYYNTLDEDAKNVLKSVVTEYSSGVSAGNDNKINEIIKNYDEVIIAKKASGFNDFMGRNPKAAEPANNNTISITTIIVIAAIAVVVIGFCIILPIIIKSKAKKRA